MSRFVREHMTGLIATILGTTVMALALGGWSAHGFVQSLATKEEVLLAGGKADYVLDRQIEALVAQIAQLERKVNLTPSELNQLNYLRGQLDRMRKVRDGK